MERKKIMVHFTQTVSQVLKLFIDGQANVNEYYNNLWNVFTNTFILNFI